MEKIWLKNYPKGVPAEINPDIYPSLAHLFDTACQNFTDKPAFTNLGSVMTYAEIDEASRCFAAYLQHKLGCRKGDRLAIMLPNLLQYPVALFGAFKAGMVVVNVNPLYTPRELEHQLRDCGATTIITLANFAHVVQDVAAETALKNIIITEIGDLFSPVKAWIVNAVVKHIKKMVPPWSIPNAIAFRDIIRTGHDLLLQPVELTGEDIALLQYTGGTTGVSKGAVLTHRNMVANVEQASSWLIPFTEAGHEIIITALPLYHIFSLTANCLTFVKLGALNVLITNPRDMNGFIKELARYKFTAITGVNTLFNALLNNPKFVKLDFSRFRLALGGGMAVQRVVAERWATVTGKPLLEAYGLTETSPAVTINPLDLKAYNGSIGLPVPSTEMSIRNEEGKELAIGEIGELCVRGPQVMRGYWNRSDETANVMCPDGFLKTGDVAMADAEGFFYLKERKKDMILVSGFNVYPNEIEDVIAKHPGVLEVAVVGVPSESSGEVVKAFVVRKDAALQAEDIIHFCREMLTAYKVPKVVEFRNELPKSNVGKILRRALR